MEHLLAHSGHIYSYINPKYRLFGYLLSTEFRTSSESFDIYWVKSIYHKYYEYNYEDTFYARNKPELYYLSKPENLINVSKSHLLYSIYTPGLINKLKDSDERYNMKIYRKYDDILVVS